jgi:hypothetical protein
MGSLIYVNVRDEKKLDQMPGQMDTKSEYTLTLFITHS